MCVCVGGCVYVYIYIYACVCKYYIHIHIHTYIKLRQRGGSVAGADTAVVSGTSPHVRRFRVGGEVLLTIGRAHVYTYL